MVTVRGPATGSILSGVDSIVTQPAEMTTSGSAVSVSGTDTGMPRITLADAVTQRVKWLWTIPPGWDAVAVQFVAINEAAGTGNVKYQFAYKLIYIGEGNVDGAVTTVSMAALASTGQFDFNYLIPSEIQAIATPDVFGKPQMLCSLSRLGADAADTLAGGVSIALAIGARVEL